MAYSQETGFIVFGNENVFYYPKAKTPLGSAKMLSLGHNEQAIKIMTGIAKVLGGFVEESDYTGVIKMYDGMLTEEDGLSYFLKYAVIHDRIEPGENGIEELRASIEAWKEKHSR